jgi:hypothetical protein
MMLTAFDLGAERVLLIAPSDFSRKQTAEKFRSLKGLQAAGVVDLPENEEDRSTQFPDVKTVDREVTDIDLSNSKQEAADYEKSCWNYYYDGDVVVALPNTISKVFNEDIVLPPQTSSIWSWLMKHTTLEHPAGTKSSLSLTTLRESYSRPRPSGEIDYLCRGTSFTTIRLIAPSQTEFTSVWSSPRLTPAVKVETSKPQIGSMINL